MESTTDFEKLSFLYKAEGKNRNWGTLVSVSAKIRNIEVMPRQSRQPSGTEIYLKSDVLGRKSEG